MLKDGFTLGGEQSGHIIMADLNTTGDGMAMALKLAGFIKKSGVPLSDLAKIVTIYPQIMVNAKVSNEKKYKYMDDAEIAMACNALLVEFAGEGRVLIRPSGTEPLVRVMIEGKDRKYIEKKANELAELIERKLA
jgi:phosphoglucosamine mutase